MFEDAIETALKFTRPIRFIQRFYGSTDVFPSSATFFFVNADGWALTCKHVVEALAFVEQLKQKEAQFRKELATTPATHREKQVRRELERKYGYTHSSVFQMLFSIVDSIEGNLSIECRVHPSADIALLHFVGYTKLLCTTFPKFAASGTDLKQGKFLCRLGYPFPEFGNFKYDPATDEIQWVASGKIQSPHFPIEGMLTRGLAGADGAVFGFEMSSPGLRGQSGGPAFDKDGRIWGMQSATAHLDLDFDVDLEVIRNGKKKRITNNAVLHVGHCINIDTIKDFMRSHNVQFQEG